MNTVEIQNPELAEVEVDMDRGSFLAKGALAVGAIYGSIAVGPFVRRALARFTSQGYAAHDLHRATLVRYRGTHARVVLIARMSLFGTWASRLHDGLLHLVAEIRGDGPSTPLVRGGHLYGIDRFKGLKCIEMKTGKVKWEGEHVTPRGRNPQASLVWAGDKALILNEKGELLVAALNAEGCKVLGKTSIIGPTWAHPAYADGCVFARNDEEVVCVPLVPKGEK